MPPTINSHLKLGNVNVNRLHSELNHLKSIEDLPYDSYELTTEGRSSVDLVIRYPLKIFDGSVSQFLAILFGELSLLKSFLSIRFEWLEVPEAVYSWFEGPKFGAEGVADRFELEVPPLLMAIIKPSLGDKLSMDYIRRSVIDVLQAGFHAVKDDEMQGNLASTRLNYRIEFARSCKKYVPTLNLDPFDESWKIASDGGMNMAMINATLIGFPMLSSIRKTTSVALLSHLSFYGTYMHSFSHRLLAFLHRLFGCDAFITPIGDVGYYAISQSDQNQIVNELVRPLPIRKTMPLLTGGARLSNLDHLMQRDLACPYGLVFGTQVFGSSLSPGSMAREVRTEVTRIRRDS